MYTKIRLLLISLLLSVNYLFGMWEYIKKYNSSYKSLNAPSIEELKKKKSSFEYRPGVNTDRIDYIYPDNLVHEEYQFMLVLLKKRPVCLINDSAFRQFDCAEYEKRLWSLAEKYQLLEKKQKIGLICCANKVMVFYRKKFKHQAELLTNPDIALNNYMYGFLLGYPDKDIKSYYEHINHFKGHACDFNKDKIEALKFFEQHNISLLK